MGMNAERKLSIWKFLVDLNDEVDVKMPRGARLLHVGEQCGEIFLWAMMDPNTEFVVRRIAVRGTGHPCDESLFDAPHIGTVFTQSNLVFHLFDRGEIS